MPAVSQKQYKFMQMLAHNKEKARQKGMKPEQAAEYIKGNVGKYRFKSLQKKTLK